MLIKEWQIDSHFQRLTKPKNNKHKLSQEQKVWNFEF